VLDVPTPTKHLEWHMHQLMLPGMQSWHHVVDRGEPSLPFRPAVDWARHSG